MKTILKLMVKISFVKAAFFLFLFLPVCHGNDLGRLKFSTPCFHALYWERYGE